MNTNILAMVIAGAVAVTGCCAFAGAASADMNSCTSGITAVGRAANPANYDPPRHYDMKALAHRRAIEAWRAKAADQCPHASNIWWRATDRKIDCEGYAGGIECEAVGKPAHRLFH